MSLRAPASESPQPGLRAYLRVRLAGPCLLKGDVVAHRPVPFHRRQCVIYDSDRADARLIGVEYVVSEDVRTLGLAASRLELAQKADAALGESWY